VRFNEQKLFEFDTEFIGSGDLPMIWDMQQEWYQKHTPLITYKELAREGFSRRPTVVDKLWYEPYEGKLTFERAFKVRAHTVFPDNKPTHFNRGTEDIRQDTFYFGLRMLELVDVFPSMGDHLIFDANAYEIRQVVLEPDNFWGETNIPLHVTCRCDKFRYGGNKIPSSLLDKEVR